MPRPYRSVRRAESARRTRQDILEAAVLLHGRGVTELKEIAREANVSLSTLQKHFPTKEDLFQGCVAHFSAHLELPPLEELAAIEAPRERASRIVQALCRLHEATFGYSWLAHCLQDESPTLAETLRIGQRFVDAAAAAILRGVEAYGAPAVDEGVRGFVTGLLSPLAYRSLRIDGGLSPQQAADQTARAVQLVLRLTLPQEE